MKKFSLVDFGKLGQKKKGHDDRKNYDQLGMINGKFNKRKFFHTNSP